MKIVVLSFRINVRVWFKTTVFRLNPVKAIVSAKNVDRKLREKIGGTRGLRQPLPDKPKHLHSETYDRICYQILAYESAAVKQLNLYNQDRWLPILLKLDELAADL